MHFHRQTDASTWLQKRALWAQGNAPAAAPKSSAPASQEIVAYRESIENKNIDELKTEFETQSANTLKLQQIVMEAAEDLNAPNANIDQGKKNELILGISKALEENSQLIISEQLKFSLGSHLKPAKGKWDQWITKVSLMSGTMGSMSEDMDENAPIGKRISGMMKWFKVLMTIIKGGTVAAPKSETENASAQVKNKNTVNEANTKVANNPALRSIQLSENKQNTTQGYLTVASETEQLKVKFDGSEVRNAKGEVVTGSHPLAEYLKNKTKELTDISAQLGQSSVEDKAKLAIAVFNGQKNINGEPKPVDVSKMLSDNIVWIQTQAPYRGKSKENIFQSLVEKPQGSQLNAVIADIRNKVITQKND